jgi:hypothetical protein
MLSPHHDTYGCFRLGHLRVMSAASRTAPTVRERRYMELNRQFAQRRVTLAGIAGLLVLGSFFAMPQGHAFASALLLFFRGQTLQVVATNTSDLKNEYAALDELGQLGAMQGHIPSRLDTVGSVGAAESMAGFSLAQPGKFPAGISNTPATIKALAPTQVTLTLDKTKADAYFKSNGSSQTMPAAYNGEEIVIEFPGVSIVEYKGSGGGLFVGQASQLVVNVSGAATATQLHDYLLTLPTLSSSAVTALKNIQNWQTTIPLGIPTDRVGWTSTNVGGPFGGSGVMLNDNSGIGSAILWQRKSGTQSLGVAGWGLKASDVQSVAASLH